MYIDELYLVPGAPPSSVTAEAVSATKIRIKWQPPPQPPNDQSNGNIVYYKLQYVEAGRPTRDATVVTVNATEFNLDDLKPWTDYKISISAGTSIGDGPFTDTITVRTMEFGRHSFRSISPFY